MLNIFFLNLLFYQSIKNDLFSSVFQSKEGFLLTNDITTPGIVGARIESDSYSKNFDDLYKPLNYHEAFVAADRCYFCYDAPCIVACPTDIDIPLFIRQISKYLSNGARRCHVSCRPHAACTCTHQSKWPEETFSTIKWPEFRIVYLQFCCRSESEFFSPEWFFFFCTLFKRKSARFILY